MHLRRMRAGSTTVADQLCGVVSGLAGDGAAVPVSISCVRGVRVAGLSRTPGGAGLTSPSAEAAGGVNEEPDTTRTSRRRAARRSGRRAAGFRHLRRAERRLDRRPVVEVELSN
jgi:hypothetical protein